MEVLYTDGRIEKIVKDQLTLEFMNHIVQGYIQIFHLPPFHFNDPKNEILIVNEDGLSLHLPDNPLAQQLYESLIKKYQIPDSELLYTPHFVGNVIRCLNHDVE